MDKNRSVRSSVLDRFKCIDFLCYLLQVFLFRAENACFSCPFYLHLLKLPRTLLCLKSWTLTNHIYVATPCWINFYGDQHFTFARAGQFLTIAQQFIPENGCLLIYRKLVFQREVNLHNANVLWHVCVLTALIRVRRQESSGSGDSSGHPLGQYAQDFPQLFWRKKFWPAANFKQQRCSSLSLVGLKSSKTELQIVTYLMTENERPGFHIQMRLRRMGRKNIDV